MWSADWVSAAGTWVYTLLTTAMLLVVWKQLNGLKQQLRSAAHQGIWSLWIEIDKWFVAHPELKPYFYHAKELDGDSTPETRMQVESTAEMLVDCYANIFSQRSVMGPDEFERYLGYMHRVYAGQPVFRRFVDANADWYTPDFIRSLTQGPSSKKAAGAADRRPPAGNPAASLDGPGR